MTTVAALALIVAILAVGWATVSYTHHRPARVINTAATIGGAAVVVGLIAAPDGYWRVGFLCLAVGALALVALSWMHARSREH